MDYNGMTEEEYLDSLLRQASDDIPKENTAKQEISEPEEQMPEEQMLEEQEGPTDEFVNLVNENVTEWLYYHIRGFDRSVAEFAFMRENENRL